MNQLQSRLREEIVRLTRYEASQGPLQAKVLDETERKECSQSASQHQNHASQMRDRASLQSLSAAML